MRFEHINTKEEIIKLNKLFFEYNWKPRDKIKLNLFCMLFPLAIGFFDIFQSDKPTIGPYFATFSIIFIFIYLSTYFKYLTSKEKHNALVRQRLNQLEANVDSSIIEIDNDYFYFKDYKSELKLKWWLLESANEYKDILILRFSSGNYIIINNTNKAEDKLIKDLISEKISLN